jgi:predicted transcriptional regulator of viral defense system
MPTPPPTAADRAIDVFRRRGGVLRTKEAIAAGVHPRTLYELRDAGVIEAISRGVHRLAGRGSSVDPDLLAVAARVPRAVICLASALVVHELTTQIPRTVDIALPPGGSSPRFRHPPIRVHRFGGASMTEGVTTRVADGVTIRCFNAEKTIADCFRFRNRIGLEIALEALRLYRSRRKQDLPALMRYARIDRVDGVMRPYLEATLA